MSCIHKGARAELIVAEALMAEGYDVFQNICRVGPADIIALNPENRKTALIDVKSVQARYQNKDGSYGATFNHLLGYRNGIWYIGYIFQDQQIVYPEGFFESLY